MSISTEIDRLKEAKESIRAAIESKGVEVDEEARLDDMAAKILDITIKPPSLTQEQKNELTSLATRYNYSYYRKSFKYTGSALRNVYTSSGTLLNSDNLIKVNCGLYCGLLWAGVDVNSFVTADSSSGTTVGVVNTSFNGDLLLKFDWGYEFVYPFNSNWGLRNPDTDEPYGFYDSTLSGYNSYNDEINGTGPYLQKYYSYQTAADMAYELYAGGYEIQMKDMEVGDLLFFRARDLSDKMDDPDENIRFRNITHVAMVTDVKDVGEYNDNRSKLVSITESTSMLGSSYPIANIGYTSTSNSSKTRLSYLMTHVVMVARHPAAFGVPSNITQSVNSSGKRIGKFTTLKASQSAT